MPWGELAAISTAVMWSLTAVFFSYSGGRIGSGVVNRSRLIFAFLFLTVMHVVLQGTLFPWDAEPFRWFWLAVSSILGLVLGDTFLFRAYVQIGPRYAMLLMSTVPIFSVFFGFVLFGETITGIELSGILLAVAGIAWVVTEPRPERSRVENKRYKTGILFGLAGALGQVANLVTARYGLVGGFPSISATVMRIVVALIVLWGITTLRGQVRASFRAWRDRRAFFTLLGGSFTGPFLGIWLSLIAIQNTRLGIASILMALPPVLLIPIETILYKRPVSSRSVMGTLIAVTGIALIFLPQ